MDYEKLYKEALERARKLYHAAKVLEYEQDIKDYEEIFPELAESEGEDERIRNDLKRAISVALDYSYLDKECANNCLAWLEKQAGAKERPTWSEEDEKFLNQVIEYVNYALNDEDMFYTGASPIIDWLKSIKQRLGG